MLNTTTEDRILHSQSANSIRDTARRLGNEFANAPSRHTLGFPGWEIKRLQQEGLLAAPLSAHLGSAGLGIAPGTHLALLEVLASVGGGNLSVGRLYEGHVNALLLIQYFGTEEQQQQAARDVQNGFLFGVWNTGPEKHLQFSSTEDIRFSLTGGKTFASGAGNVQRPIVTGNLPNGAWQMCILPMEEIACQIDRESWRPLGMENSCSFAIDFTGSVVSGKMLLGKAGDYYRQPMFSGGAIRFAAVQLGAAERLMYDFHAWLQRLRRTEDPYQTARMGQLVLALESGRQWLKGAAEKAEQFFYAEDPKDSRIMVEYANMTRTAIETICLEVMRFVTSGVGVRGLLEPHPFEQRLRDLTMYLRQPAPDQALASVGRFVLEQPAAHSGIWSTKQDE